VKGGVVAMADGTGDQATVVVIDDEESRRRKGNDLPGRDDGDASLIKFILRKASRFEEFGRKLLYEGPQELAGWGISRGARRAILTGNTAWLTSRCGELTSEEREWLDRHPW
jgi:hypothetical protein